MKKIKLGISILYIAIAASAPTAMLACSMPSEVTLLQSFLSFKYPDAMHVTGATWSLRKGGRLAMPDGKRIMATGTEREQLDEAARLAALESLAILGDALNSAGHQDHSISITLVERMHKERLMPRGRLEYDPLAKDPEDDLMLVTTEPVLHAIALEEMTIAEAMSHGVVRLYGTDAQLAAFRADFDRIGTQAQSVGDHQMSMVNHNLAPVSE